jgi:glucokinase
MMCKSNKGYFMTRLIADIGGTNARFGIVTDKGIEEIKVFSCKDHATPAAAAKVYLADVKIKPETGAFAVATPLDGTDRVTMTNHVWDFSIEETKKEIGLQRLKVVNDFTAISLSVPYIEARDLVQIGEGTPRPHMPVGIIGPGTGLGVGLVVFEEGRPIVVATEGGHVTMPAATAREFALFEYLRWTKYRHVSAERVCSGKGLVNLYHAVCGVDGLDLPEREAADIAAAGLDKSCRACEEALSLLCHFLGVVAGNLALSSGAQGGIYIAGGIVPKLGDYFAASRFRQSFEAKGRFSGYMARIPTYIVTHPQPGLEGLRRLP